MSHLPLSVSLIVVSLVRFNYGSKVFFCFGFDSARVELFLKKKSPAPVRA